ncbi:MAG: hypothetical protein HY080_04760 [Gammaproteobacteria bacterium]|nr:hypothetical protein [Gammaproteobacteria bacterium]
MTRSTLVLGLWCSFGLALGAGKDNAQDYLWHPVFQFQQQGGAVDAVPAVLLDRQHASTARINQYNATLSYPWRNDNVNLGIGINLRFIEGDVRSSTDSSQSISAAMPMVYASAWFDLPLNGLRAGVIGRHMDYDQWRAYDYRAKLIYSFDSGFGMQGGWQLQQLNLDTGTDNRGRFENKGPFMDLYWRF